MQGARAGWPGNNDEPQMQERLLSGGAGRVSKQGGQAGLISKAGKAAEWVRVLQIHDRQEAILHTWQLRPHFKLRQQNG